MVSECQNGPLFDQSLFDKCLDYIIALSWYVVDFVLPQRYNECSSFIKPFSGVFSTPPRFYRQMASLMGLQLVTSFINVAKMLGSQRETTQRQLNAEQKKSTEGPRVESLTTRLSMTHEKITAMEEMMRKTFTGCVDFLFGHNIDKILFLLFSFLVHTSFSCFKLIYLKYLHVEGYMCIVIETLIQISGCHA